MVTKDLSELPDPMRKRSRSFYVVLLALVAPLWSTVPLSWAFVIYSLRSGRIWSYSWLGGTAFAVALCEVYFSIYHYHLARRISGPTPHGPGKLVDIQTAFFRLLKSGLANLPEDGFDEESLDVDRPGSPVEAIVQLEHDDPRAVDFRFSLRNWFGRATWSSIRLHEVRQWLHWSIFNTEMPPLEDLSRAHRGVLDEAVDLLQKRAGCVIPEGSTPHVKPLRLTLDKVNISLRPLWGYVFVGLSNWLLKLRLQRTWNTRYGSFNGLEYLLHTPKVHDPIEIQQPIVFVHGLGAGLLGYSVVITHLIQKFPGRPLLFLLQPHVSQNIFHPRYLKPMTRHETASALAGLLVKLGWVYEPSDILDQDVKNRQQDVKNRQKAVTMISHSNGSYAHAWMLKEHPEMVARSCFVDPVTFCSWEGDVCYNVIYRPCVTGFDLLMRYFVVTELGIANHFQRHFDWSSNALWYEEIPNAKDRSKTLFVLGGEDAIVNTERVVKYLRSHGVRKSLWLDPTGQHGQALMTGGRGFTEIIRWLEEKA